MAEEVDTSVILMRKGAKLPIYVPQLHLLKSSAVGDILSLELDEAY